MAMVVIEALIDMSDLPPSTSCIAALGHGCLDILGSCGQGWARQIYCQAKVSATVLGALILMARVMLTVSFHNRSREILGKPVLVPQPGKNYAE